MTRRAGLVAAVLLAAGLAAGAALGAGLDPQLAEAVALRHSGRAEAAVARLEALALERPHDADVRLHLGLALEAAGRPAEARLALIACLQLAPGYVDARTALERIERGRSAGWRVDLHAAYSHLTRGLQSWRAAGAAISRTTPQGALIGRLEETRRFGRSDLFAEAMAVRPLRGRAEVHLAAGGVLDEADHRPRLALRAGALSPAAPLADGLALQGALDAEWARYPSGEVKGLHPALVLSHGDRLSLTLKSYNLIDEQRRRQSGWGVAADWAASPRLTLRAGYADAPETSEGRTVPVRAVSLGAGWTLDDRTSLRIDAVHEDRRAYARREIAVGLARRF